MKLKRKKRALKQSSVCSNCEDLYAYEKKYCKPEVLTDVKEHDITKKSLNGIPVPRNCPAKRYVCVTCGRETELAR
jgi:hypothetical protein